MNIHIMIMFPQSVYPPAVLLKLLGCIAICATASSCPPLTARAPPTDILDLRPVDVRFMGSMGDSFTAGFGLSGYPFESRDQVYSTGTDTGAKSVANFLSASQSNSTIIVQNVAVSGDVVQGQMKQAERLIKAIKNSKQIDFEQDWKLVTILIGGNNQRTACPATTRNMPDTYYKELTAVLELLESSLPRTFVSLLTMTNMTAMASASGVDQHCKVEHLITRKEVPCAFGSEAEGIAMDTIIQEDNAQLYTLQDMYRAKGLKDFAVVVQPFFQDFLIPDWTYLSRVDCFHPSRKAHQNVARALWQNLFEPVGKKTTDPSVPTLMFCPSDTDTFQS